MEKAHLIPLFDKFAGDGGNVTIPGVGLVQNTAIVTAAPVVGPFDYPEFINMTYGEMALRMWLNPDKFQYYPAIVHQVGRPGEFELGFMPARFFPQVINTNKVPGGIDTLVYDERQFLADGVTANPDYGTLVPKAGVRGVLGQPEYTMFHNQPTPNQTYPWTH
jgi:hypothetical protein